MLLRQRDRILLLAAAAAAAAASLRVLGPGVTVPAAALLAAAALIALAPLNRIFGEAGGSAADRRAVLAVVFGIHLVATLFFFPPEDIVNERPVLTLDHALHYYQAERAREVFGDHLRCHTYDPYFMAGYPGGTVFDVDSKGIELWCALLRPLDTPRAYKLFILIGHLLLPITVYAGTRLLGFRFDESVFGVLVLLAWWHWGRPYASDYRFAGMFSYLAVMHLSLYLAGLFRSLLRAGRSLMFFIVGPLAFLVHPTAAVLLPAPLLALFLVERRGGRGAPDHRRRELRLLVSLTFWCLLVIAVNAPWIVQLFRYLDIKVASQTFFQVAGPVEMARLLFKWGNLPAIGMAACAAAGAAMLIRDGRGDVAAAPLAGTVFLVLISTFGIYLPLVDQLEPGRFIVPAFVFMSPLAGAGCIRLLSLVSRPLIIRSRSISARTAAAVVLALGIPASGMLSARAFYRHTLGTTFTPEVKEMLDATEKYVNTSGRLMIEDGPAWNYGDSFLVSIIPLRTGVEQIGGPYPFAFIEHNFSNFAYCRAFEKMIGTMEAGLLRRYLDMYNVHWIMTASDDCRKGIGEKGIATAVWSSRHFTLWEVDGPSTFADVPGVSVSAGYGTLRVTIEPGAGTEPGRSVLLKYHWDRGMSVEPPARISPHRILDDPVPFIMLEPNGASEIQIIVK